MWQTWSAGLRGTRKSFWEKISGARCSTRICACSSTSRARRARRQASAPERSTHSRSACAWRWWTRCLRRSSRFLLLDDPFVNLDDARTKRALELLQKISAAAAGRVSGLQQRESLSNIKTAAAGELSCGGFVTVDRVEAAGGGFWCTGRCGSRRGVFVQAKGGRRAGRLQAGAVFIETDAERIERDAQPAPEILEIAFLRGPEAKQRVFSALLRAASAEKPLRPDESSARRPPWKCAAARHRRRVARNRARRRRNFPRG